MLWPGGRLKSPKVFQKGESSLNITDVRMKKVGGTGKVKAVGSITVGPDFVVHEVKVINGVNGLFVALPSKKMADGTFKDLVHPITAAAREVMQKMVLEKYALAMETGPANSLPEETAATTEPMSGTATDGAAPGGEATPATATSGDSGGPPVSSATEVTVQAVTVTALPAAAAAAEPAVAVTLAVAAESDAGDGSGESGEATGVHEAASWLGPDSGLGSRVPISASASQDAEDGSLGRHSGEAGAGGSSYRTFNTFDGQSMGDTRAYRRQNSKGTPITGAGAGETAGPGAA